jgi:subtilase family serine protease
MTCAGLKLCQRRLSWSRASHGTRKRASSLTILFRCHAFLPVFHTKLGRLLGDSNGFYRPVTKVCLPDTTQRRTSLIREGISRISISKNVRLIVPGSSMSNRTEALLRASASLCFVTFIFSILSNAVTVDRVTSVIDSGTAIALQKSLHPKAKAKYDRGPVEPSFKLASITLMTVPSAAQQKALNQLLAQQQDPASPNYHKWLTPSQYAEQFGLSQNDLNRITAWLKAQGFVVHSVGGGRNTVRLSGTAAQVQSAFGAEIHRYSVDGEEHFANATPLMLPAALKGVVSGIVGVHDFRMHPASRPRLGPASGASANYYDGALLFPNFLAPADVATIYDIPSTLDGSGETIAILGRSDIFLTDINDFRTAFGLTPITATNCTLNTIGIITACNDPRFSYVLLLPSGQKDPGVPDSIAAGDATEADLDVEWSGGVAPNAQIVYINAPSKAGNDVFDALIYALNPPTGTPIPAPVVSLSFSLCEAFATSFETYLQQGASEGITIVNSSGDSGAAACDANPPNNATAPPFPAAVGGLSVGYPASSPWVTGVGGTAVSLADDSYPNPSSFWARSNGASGGSATSYIPEISWNDNETWAAYCAAPTKGDTFCSTGNSTSGWIAINSAQSAQQDLWIGSGGGGASNCFSKSTQSVCTGGLSQPTYQKSLVVPNAPSGVRWVPDVSLLASANFPGYILCTPQNPDATTPVYTSTCVNGISGSTGALERFSSVIGGTSASAPVFAGMVALLNQYLAGPSSPGLGLINPMLYRLAAAIPTNHAFHQVTTSDNKVYCSPGQPITNPPQPAAIICPTSGIFGYSASGAGNFDPTTSYNLVTGLGSVDLDNLAVAWAGTRSPTTIVSLVPSATQINRGQNVTFKATLSSTAALGNVSFFNNGSTTALGMAALTSTGNGVVTFSTTSLPAGTDSVRAMYDGDGSNAPSPMSAAATLTVIQPSFTLAPAVATYSVAQGSSVTATINLTAQNGFNTPLTYSCSVPAAAAGATCTGPSGATTATSVSFQIKTVAPSFAMNRPLDRGSRIFYALLLPGLLGIVFTVGLRNGSLRGMQMLGLIIALGVSTLWLGSCGGSNNSSTATGGTPKGPYTVTVNATTGGSVPVTGSTTFQLTVQ